MQILESRPTFENPVTGERYEVREHTPDVLEMDYSLSPGGFAVGRVEHAHPRQAETFEIRSGELTVSIDGDEWTATPGTRFTIPAKTPHAVRNENLEEMRASVEIRPSLDVLAFLETMAGLGRDGATNEWGLPGPLQLAVLAHEFREELSFPALPVTVQRALAATLAPVGRSLGYRARYARYSDRL